MRGARRFARNLWRLTRIYWASPAARKGGVLLALAVALELSTVYGNVLLAGVQRRVFDAVQDKQMSAFLAMGLTHLVGRPLVPINLNRMRVEADFRYGLVRFRDNVEAVALACGATFEQRGALGRFQYVIQNWWQLISAQRNLNLFTTMIGQANAVVPILIAAPADKFPDDRIREVLRLLELSRLEIHLDDTAQWEQQLSADEQQRLTIARVLLHEPDWIFLDGPTAALDEAMEKQVYEILAARLPAATVMSMTHRPAVAQYHARRWTMLSKDEGPASLQTA